MLDGTTLQLIFHVLPFVAFNVVTNLVLGWWAAVFLSWSLHSSEMDRLDLEMGICRQL